MKDKHNATPATAPEEDNMEDLRVTLTLDDNSEMECQILTIFDLGDQNYIVLTPADDEGDEEETEIFIYRYFEDEDGNPSLENIEDDEELEAVTDRFEELLDEAEWDEWDELDELLEDV